MIYTFYSYKGGVGRSMALANVAEWFYRQGLRAVMMDWDLEAPGLENYFYQTPAELEEVRSQLGLIDLLTSYKRMFPRLPLARAQAAKVGGGGEDGANSEHLAATLAVLQEHLPPVAPMLFPVHAPEAAASDGDVPALWLLPAGCRAGDRFASYAQAVQDFNWSDFYLAYEGEAYFEWLRSQLTAEGLADVVLIDSRTGVTEMGGVCTRQLADVVVSFCVPNLQNLSGVEVMARSFRRPEVVAKRRRKIEVVMVPTRIDVSELDARNSFEKEFRARLDQFTPPAFCTVKSEFWNLAIQYIPKYAYAEKLAINATDTARELEEAYKKIAAHLVLLAEGESGLRVRRKYTAELFRVFGMLMPSLVIAYGDEFGRRIANDLRTRLAAAGISAWPDPPTVPAGQESLRQLMALLDQSRAFLVVVTAGAAQSERLQRLWRYARQQGVAVFAVTAGEPPDSAPWPVWLRHYYNLDREWDALVPLLQSPPPTARVPFMVPDLPPNYVERPDEVRRVKEALLGDKASALVGLWGPAGSGKKVLAVACCHDEDVIAHFADGILWAALGPDTNAMGELAKLYAALTGEMVRFADEKEAVTHVAERVSGKNCLLVIEDAWDLKSLRPLLDAAPRCRRLILTRDLNTLTSVGAAAIMPGDLKTEEAVALLTAQLNLSPQEAAEFAPFTERLGRWPLALRLANAQLRKLVGQGVGARGALDFLNQSLNKLGALAFDQPNVPDSDESVARSLALTLDHLSTEERERYAQIAFFPPNELITSAKLAARWQLDEFEAEKLLQRFAELALIKYDLTTKTVHLGSVLRDYILNPASGYDLNSRYEAAFSHLSPEQQAIAQRMLVRLVRLALPNEKAGDTRLTADFAEFDAAERQVLPALAEARLVEIETDGAGAQTVQLAGEEVLRNWTRLREWLQGDREFLLWRQSLRRQMAEWEAHRDRGALLSGVPLRLASTYLIQREADLNEAERAYIAASQQAEQEVQEQLQTAEQSKQIAAQSVKQLQRTRRLGAIIVAVLVTFGLVVGGFLLYRAYKAQQATMNTDRALNLNNEGRALAESGKFDEAIAKYTEAIRLKPDLAEAYVNLGDTLRQKGDAAGAAQAYSSAIEYGRNDPAIFAARGQARLDSSDANGAVADFTEAIMRSPGEARFYTARSNAYLTLNQTDEARRDLEQARLLTAPAPSPDSTGSTLAARVFLQYNDPDDRAFVQQLAKDLRARGYNVPRAELRPERTDGEVRYFNEADAKQASEVAARAGQSLAAAGVALKVTARFVSSPKYTAPPGQIEVWLPTLQNRASSSPVQQQAAPAQKQRLSAPAAKQPPQKSAQKYE